MLYHALEWEKILHHQRGNSSYFTTPIWASRARDPD